MFRVLSIAILSLIGIADLVTDSATAGPFDSYLTSGVSPTSIVAWARAVEDYSPTSEVVHLDSFGGGPHDVPTRGLGPADGATVSLGDLDSLAISGGTAPGSIVVSFQASRSTPATPMKMATSTASTCSPGSSIFPLHSHCLWRCLNRPPP